MSHTHKNNGWRFCIDRGGTFTDIVVIKPDGQCVNHKLLSENPQQYNDAAIQGIKEILKLSDDEPMPRELVREIRMGTTVATNALLERHGAKTGLIISRGFRDALQIGYQNRPDIFALHIKKRDMLYSSVSEIDERVTNDGTVITSPNVEQIKLSLQQFKHQGIESIAIACMHSYQYPDHEILIARIAAAIGFDQVYCSHTTSPLIKFISRTDTTVADAYLSPVLQRYINTVTKQTENVPLKFMQSSGGLCSPGQFHGKDAVLSGPAGGIIGMAHIAEKAGISKVIGFDMGGTSTDVSHYAGDFERDFDTEITGVRLRVPMMRIHTVAAGGGSIIKFDGERYLVGPESAGALPGPACYRNNGPLTVTDCNVMLGKLRPEWFPAVFGANGDERLDLETVTERFRQLTAEINSTLQTKHSMTDVAAGFLSIAIDNMAAAIKKISIERGYNISEYTLCSFGGAGGQHACLVADALGMRQILIHPQASVLSAMGIGIAKSHIIKEVAIECPLTPALMMQLESQFEQLENETRELLISQTQGICTITSKRRCHIHYQDSDTQLLINFGTQAEIETTFSKDHKRQFGFTNPDTPLIIAAIQVEMIADTSEVLALTIPPSDASKQNRGKASKPSGVKPLDAITTIMANQEHTTPVFTRSDLTQTDRLSGPALIIEPNSTIVVEPGWDVSIFVGGELLLCRQTEQQTEYPVQPGHTDDTDSADPVLLEVFNNRFMSIAEQMGVVLQNTARSVNIKERLDFSCAIFDANGQLLANAPHIPVHIGSMSDTVVAVIHEHGDNLRDGDVFISNNPYNGGTHLPDVTIIRPIFIDNQITAYVAARGHHADIGGITPGSMPAHSTRIEEEGIIFDNKKIISAGVFAEQEIRQCLGSPPWPARNIDQNIADFKAQIAACERGAQELASLCTHYGRNVVLAYMSHIQDYAERAVKRLLSTLQPGEFSYQMDDGSSIRVKIQLSGKTDEKICFDFSGSSSTHSGNLNAPRSVCKAAVLYVLRCLIDEDIPLNAGFLRPVELLIPSGSILNPDFPQAVVAGNVETSQIVVDTLLGALGAQAGSQGTCNNFTFGNDQYQYYETLCGGTGASNGYPGCDAIHSHMTNSRLTDPEILEQRYPVILESFQIREHSGGNGKYPGGNGITRRLQFRQPMTASIISGQRTTQPFGLQGGEAGQCGNNYIERVNGHYQQLSGNDQVNLQTGDVFIVESPGGGGFGKPD